MSAGNDTSFPNTFLIGAQKSGTTFLGSLLDRSDDVELTFPKETHILTKYPDAPEPYFAKHFEGSTAKIRMDGSTTSTFLRPKDQLHIEDAPGLTMDVPNMIKDRVPDAKLIYIMRDPVKRLISAAGHNLRSQHVKNSVSLRDLVKKDPMLLLISRYADQLERYLDVFDRKDILLLRFEDLKSDPAAVLEETCAFLEIDPVEPEVNEVSGQGKKNAARRASKFGAMARRFTQRHRDLSRNLNQIVKKTPFHSFLKAAAFEEGQVQFHDIDFVEDALKDEEQKLLDLVGFSWNANADQPTVGSSTAA